MSFCCIEFLQIYLEKSGFWNRISYFRFTNEKINLARLNGFFCTFTICYFTRNVSDDLPADDAALRRLHVRREQQKHEEQRKEEVSLNRTKAFARRNSCVTIFSLSEKVFASRFLRKR